MSKPLSSNPPKQSSSGREKPTNFKMHVHLAVAKDEPRRYKCEVSLFNDPSKVFMELMLMSPIGSVEVLYMSDFGTIIGTPPFQLHDVPGTYGKLAFEDKFDDIHWQEKLKIGLIFNKGAIRYFSDGLEKTNDITKEEILEILEIYDRPENVLAGIYELCG